MNYNLFNYTLTSDTYFKIIETVIVIFFIWISKYLILKFILSKKKDSRTVYHYRKALTYFSVIVITISIGAIWLRSINSLVTFLGLITAGLTIALREPVLNLLGWIFILWRRPFILGDRIQIGKMAGDVVDLRIFQFTVLEIGNWVDADQSTGRIIHIPNAKVFTDYIANYTSEFNFIWNELPVGITFESNWKKAKHLLQEIIDRHEANLSNTIREQIQKASERYMIIYSKLTPIIYTSVKEFGIVLTVRYMCEPRRRRSTEQAIWEEILRCFK